MRASSVARARVVRARLDADGALPDRRQKLVDAHDRGRVRRRGRAASGRRAPAASRRPRRRRACAAASRHCRAAARRRRSGRSALDHRLPAQRGGAERRAVRQFAQATCALRLMNTSRGSSRSQAGRQHQARPADTSACPWPNAPRDRCAPASSASSISLVNRPLPPTSASGRSWMRVAGGADDVDLDRVLRRRRSAAASRARTMRACTSASGLPRVPMRRMGGGLRHVTSRC